MTTLKSKVGQLVIPLLPLNRRTFDILRYELTAALTHWRNTINPVFWIKIATLRKRRGLSINLGSGGTGRADWINVELRRHADTTLCLDIRKPLPFADGSAVRVIAEHVLEHLDFSSDAPALAREVCRILEHGGTFRVVVPDCERQIRAYVSGQRSEFSSLGWDLDNLPHDYTHMNMVNHVFHQDGEHLFGYDFETLELLLRKAGFRYVERRQFRESRDPAVAVDHDVHKPYSLYVDAVK